MVISEIRLYEMLKAKLGEKEAEAFVEILEKKVDQKFETKSTDFATKTDLNNLRTELQKTIYQVSLGQVVAIIASVISIMLLLRK